MHKLMTKVRDSLKEKWEILNAAFKRCPWIVPAWLMYFAVLAVDHYRYLQPAGYRPVLFRALGEAAYSLTHQCLGSAIIVAVVLIIIFEVMPRLERYHAFFEYVSDRKSKLSSVLASMLLVVPFNYVLLHELNYLRSWDHHWDYPVNFMVSALLFWAFTQFDFAVVEAKLQRRAERRWSNVIEHSWVPGKLNLRFGTRPSNESSGNA